MQPRQPFALRPLAVVDGPLQLQLSSILLHFVSARLRRQQLHGFAQLPSSSVPPPRQQLYASPRPQRQQPLSSCRLLFVFARQSYLQRTSFFRPRYASSQQRQPPRLSFLRPPVASLRLAQFSVPHSLSAFFQRQLPARPLQLFLLLLVRDQPLQHLRQTGSQDWDWKIQKLVVKYQSSAPLLFRQGSIFDQKSELETY